jgi:hypothetical protein
MSFAAQTWTIDTASSPWIYSDGTTTTVSGTSETLAFTAVDTGAGGVYLMNPAQSITLADGNELIFEANPQLCSLRSEADGATINNGSLWVYIAPNGKREEVKVVTMTVTNGDAVGANNVANITFEYPGKPYSWSWTNINTA